MSTSLISLCNFLSYEIFVLGVAEAGFFPGTIYIYSVYYRRYERSWRVAIFFGGVALAGAFGGQIHKSHQISDIHSGVLAYAIGKMDGIGGKQWLVYGLCGCSEPY